MTKKLTNESKEIIRRLSEIRRSHYDHLRTNQETVCSVLRLLLERTGSLSINFDSAQKAIELNVPSIVLDEPEHGPLEGYVERLTIDGDGLVWVQIREKDTMDAYSQPLETSLTYPEDVFKVISFIMMAAAE